MGVYTFPDDVAAAHRAHQQHLAGRRAAGDAAVIEVAAPASGRTYLIERRRPTGRPIVVVEPHHDDLVLSASGLLLAQPRPLTVVTVFTRSATAHPTVLARYPGQDAVTALRAREARQALLPLQAGQRMLGHRDAAPPYRPYDPAALDHVTAELRDVLAEAGDAELLAPAAVTRHPDHLLVHEAARRLGCRWFWEDLAFWQTYGMSPDDRHLFRRRVGGTLTAELVDITGVLLDKLTLLYVHGSQLQPPHAMYRPLRHAWTTAAALRDGGAGAVCFAERFYRQERP
ncbi:PIG-L deacetylase family protein [Planomonospora corallina]|uniref:PIG-L deacetylase family protein n=1 Tax=Planomonospora corallina TaxID=1806052 RepID=A0ABV8IB44_9ACTN